MNACRAATRPTSNANRRMPNGIVNQPSAGDAEQHGERARHEQDDQVAGEDVGEQTDRQRQDPHQVGEDLEEEDEHRHAARDAGGDEAFEVADRALGADPFDV